MMRRGWRLAVAIIGVACSTHAPPAGAVPAADCVPVDGQLAASAPWDSLNGSWMLEMVAVTGDSSGVRAAGTLTLRAQDPALRPVVRAGMTGVTVPVIGATDIALERVGAVRIGDVGSLDPRKPGVSIWVSPATATTLSAVMRIGQEEIQSDLVRFDGGYTALYLRQVSATAIRGGWASAVAGTAASGYFCAERVEKAS